MQSKSPTLSNADIARYFRNVAAVSSINGENIFKIKAYENAANSIEQYGMSLQEMWKQEGGINKIPGVGKAIAADLQELFETGHVKHYDALLALVPQGLFGLLPVSGIGAKTAYKLATHFNLNEKATAIETLKSKALAGEIAKVPGFSEISQKRILSAIENMREKPEKRLLFPVAFAIALDVCNYLRTSPAVEKVEALGSLRRKAPTVGDIDIAVATNDIQAVFEHIKNCPHNRKTVNIGTKSMMFIHTSGWQIDIKTQDPSMWGAMLQHYTGSKNHNVHLRKIAQEKGWSVSEYGIEKDGKRVAYDSEEKFYEALGLAWVPPELREDWGEIELAQKDSLPKLIELSDIRGDMHIHTNLPFPTSHDMGRSQIDDILLIAKELGYSHIGLSDHNPKRSGLSAKERFEVVQKRNNDIDEVVGRFFKGKTPTIKVYKGLEIDILPDGNLALEDEAIDLLDYCIVSLHSQFKQPRDEMTKRILKALTHPKVLCMGHPTGRILEERDGADADWDVIFSHCKEKGIAMEINSSPDRIDLPSPLIKKAIGAGVKLIINTDSHQAESLHLMPYGISNARRGWVTKGNLLNIKEKFDL